MFEGLLTSIADAGRELVRSRMGMRRRGVEQLCRDLISTRGEASGVALARDLVETYRAMDDVARVAFFHMLAEDFGADVDGMIAAVEAYRRERGPDTLKALYAATEPKRQELFRRMNMAPGGTRAILRLREQLLQILPDQPGLREIDTDLHHLLGSWFNPGFLTLARIDWRSPAELLEKLVRYEKVHKMRSLEELKRRLAADRRCFAFFHPALPDEPLIFVQVALVQGIAAEIPPLIAAEAPLSDIGEADTAIFYSISNCQEGLRGVTLGNFLIKGVVESLKAELPELRTFATLSPVPGFGQWLAEVRQSGTSGLLNGEARERLGILDRADWPADEGAAAEVRPLVMGLCAHYLLREKRGSRPRDAVARFHLGNGARLERINWLGDPSEKGLRQSHGLLVNYGYDPSRIEANHEAYATTGEVIASGAVKKLLPQLVPA